MYVEYDYAAAQLLEYSMLTSVSSGVAVLRPAPTSNTNWVNKQCAAVIKKIIPEPQTEKDAVFTNHTSRRKTEQQISMCLEMLCHKELHYFK